jgi:hypothetical protein
MPRKQVPIFATQNDLLKVIGGVDAVRPLMFVTAGLFDRKREIFPVIAVRD